MSAYINFYLRVNDGRYIQMDYYCRSSEMYQVAQNYVNWESIKPLSTELLSSIRTDLMDKKTEYQNNIARVYEEISFLTKLAAAGAPLDEVLEQHNSYQNSIDELQQIVDEIDAAINDLRYIGRMMEVAQYDQEAKVEFFITHEFDPNYVEDAAPVQYKMEN